MKMQFFTSAKNQSGATLVEVLLAIGLLGIMLPALLTALLTANAARPTISQQVQAEGLLHEAAAAVRSAREASWNNVATDGTYHPAISGSGWTLASGSETVGNFTRQIVITDGERDGSGALVTSGGTADSATKTVTINLSWDKPVASSLSETLYLTDWQR